MRREEGRYSNNMEHVRKGAGKVQSPWRKIRGCEREGRGECVSFCEPRLSWEREKC